MIRTIKKAFTLSYFGQMETVDFLILMAVSFSPFPLIFMTLPGRVDVLLVTTVTLGCTVQLFRSDKVELPVQPRRAYRAILGSLYLFFIIVLFQFIFKVEQLDLLLLSLLFIGSLLIFVCYFLYFVSNFLYMIMLKTCFPHEFSKREKAKSWTLRKLSGGMDLDMQKRYMELSIMNMILFFCVFSYLLFWAAQFLPENSDPFINNIVQWANSVEQLTFFNWIGLFSLLIAIFSITIPAKIKMEEKARETLEEQFK